VKKSVSFFFLSFRRKPESSVFKALRNYWTPVFTGVTAEIQFFHTFGEGKGGGEYSDNPCSPARREKEEEKCGAGLSSRPSKRRFKMKPRIYYRPG